MRIVYLHQYFTTPSMTGGTRSFEFARRLVEKGHEVQVLTTRRDSLAAGRAWEETDEAGVHVHWLPIPYSNTMSYTDRLRAFARFAARASVRAAGIEADIFFATSTPLTIAIPGLFASRFRGAPMVFEVRDLWPDAPIAIGALRNPVFRTLARALERVAYLGSSEVIALSEDMAAGVRATGFPEDRVTVITNASDIALFDVPMEEGLRFRASLPWLGGRPLVLYAGALGRVNGAGYLARLAAHTLPRNGDLRFLIIGDGVEREQIRREASGLGVLDKNFFMLDSMPKSQMPSALSAATVATSLVIPVKALWKNSANKLFDALAAGRPIAINHEGWQAEMIRRNGCGLVLDAEDLESASASLLAFITSESDVAAAGLASKKLALEEFSRDLLFDRFEQVLERAASRRKAA